MRKLTLIVLLLILTSASHAQRLRQVAMIDLPGRPGFDRIIFAGNYLVISHAGANTVDVFDPAKRRLVAQVTNIAQPRGMVFDAGNSRIFAAAGSDTIYLISTQDWEIKDSFTVTGMPEDLALSSDGRTLYVTYQAGPEVAAVDVSLRRASATADTGGLVGGITTADNGTAFVSMQDQAVVLRLDSQMKAVGRFKLGASQPTDLIYDRSKNRLYIAVRAAVLEVDATNGAEIARVPASKGVNSLWFDEKAHMLFAGGGGSILLMDTSGNLRRQDEILVDVKGEALAYDSARGLIYLPGGREGHSKLLIVRQSPGTPAPAPSSSEASLRK